MTPNWTVGYFADRKLGRLDKSQTARRKYGPGRGVFSQAPLPPCKFLSPPNSRDENPTISTDLRADWAVAGVTTCAFHSLNGLTAREAGTVIATPVIMASMVYYK